MGRILSKAVSGVVLTLCLRGMLASMLAVASGDWVWVRDTVAGDYGEAVVGTGEAIYIARNISFYRYRPVDNSWVNLTSPPNPDAGDAFKTGTALAWDFNDYIYALYGANSTQSRRWFYRYSISQDSWEALASTPADQGEGDAMTWVGIDNCIYAAIGGEEERPTYFVRYDPSTNSWSNVSAAPSEDMRMGDGASLVWTGGNFLYALRGEYFEEKPLYDFWRYSLINNTWESIADIPAYPHDGGVGVGGVGDGGSLLYVGFWLQNQTNYIYALSGNQAKPEKPEPIPDKRFYRYTISTNSWKRLADLPFGVGDYVGCRLGYADGHIYAWQGSPDTWEGGGDDLARYEFPTLVPPTADFSYAPKFPVVNETVTFNASASHDPDGFILCYTWDFGDNTSVSMEDDQVTIHIYGAIGTYNVTLTVTDDDGLTHFATATLTVVKHPVAYFTFSPENPLVGETVTFNASMSTPNGGYISNYTWDFGDGFYGKGMITYHNYSEVGGYNVTLAVTDSNGLNNSAWATVTVLTHDVAVISVTPSTNEVYEGQIVNVTVAAKNSGNFTETFNVTAYANITVIQTLTVSELAPDNQITLTFTWNTTGVTLGNYTMKIEASVVPGETYSTNNVKVNGMVHVIPEFASVLLLFVVFVVTVVVSILMKRKLTSEYSFSKIPRLKREAE